MTSGRKSDVGPWRKFKRVIRSQIGWSEKSMKTQLRLHLSILFSFFFVVYFISMFLFAQVFYVELVVNKVTETDEISGQPRLQGILNNRLKYSTEAVSTMIFMTDKLLIDQSRRLSGLYKTAIQAPADDKFPIKPDAEGYELYDASQLSGDEKMYNTGVACKERTSTQAPAPLKQLKHIWEQSVMLGIGKDRQVNAHRILFLYDTDSGQDVCVYPAQNFDGFKDQDAAFVNEQYFTSITSGTNEFQIERGSTGYFESDNTASEELYTTYWAPLSGETQGSYEGVVGLQIKQSVYDFLIPSPVIEEPYGLSFIFAFDPDHELIWSYQGSDIDDEAFETEISAVLSKWLQNSRKFDNKLTTSDGTEFTTYERPSPLRQTIIDDLYASLDNKIDVICGQKKSYNQTILFKLEEFVETHLIWFMIVICLVIAFMIIIFIKCCFERQLQNKVTKPVIDLTNDIKNPKAFKQKMAKQKNKQKAKDKKGDRDELFDTASRSQQRRSTLSRRSSVVIQLSTEESQKKKKTAIDEVSALQDLFYAFFGNQNKQKKNSLVNYYPHESSINPFGTNQIQADGYIEESHIYSASHSFVEQSGLIEEEQKGRIVEERIQDHNEIAPEFIVNSNVDDIQHRLVPDWEDFYANSD